MNDLFNKFSYRYNKTEEVSFLSPLRYFKSSLKLLWTKRVPKAEKKSNGIFVYDYSSNLEKSDRDYLEYNGVKEMSFIFRTELPNQISALKKIILSLELCFVFLLLLPKTLFAKDKAKSSLIFLELTENLLLVSSLLKTGCKKLYILSANEKDITFASNLLQKNNISVYLVPSSNPISFYYKNVICDTFVFTVPFQVFEYEKLKDNWYCKQTEIWKPFESHTVKLNKSNDQEKNLPVGLMSSGCFLREKLSHTNSLGNNDYLAETALVEALKKYTKKTGRPVLVYLHPLERSNKDNLDISMKYYKQQFGEQVSFAPVDQLSKLNFNLCSVAVSGFSSAQIERLYGGYKTLFAPMGFLQNYFSDPRLDAISIHSNEEFDSMLDEAYALTEEEFFNKFSLKDYRWDSYKTLPAMDLKNNKKTVKE